MEAAGQRLVRYSDPNAEFSIWALADIHLGNKGCARHRLEADLERIRSDPYALWSLLGDYCDWISPKDPRWDPTAVDGMELTIEDMADLGAVLVAKISELLTPIRDRCLGVGYGNHDEHYFRSQSQLCCHTILCRELAAQDLKYSGFFDIYFEHKPRLKKPELIKAPEARDVRRKGQRKLSVFQHHGFSTAATPGGKINALKRLVESVDADLIMMGHVHEQFAKPFVQLRVDSACKTIKERPRMGMITGSYLRGYMPGTTLYSEKRGYSPTTIGATRARFKPGDGTLIVENGALEIGEQF